MKTPSPVTPSSVTAAQADPSLLLPADIVLFHGYGFYERLIQWGSASWWNHAALVDMDTDRLIESDDQGVHPFMLAQHGGEEILVLRVPGTSAEQRERVLEAAASDGRDIYNWALVIRLFASRILHLPPPTYHPVGNSVQCVELVTQAWAQGGVLLLSPTELPIPARLAALGAPAGYSPAGYSLDVVMGAWRK